MNNDECTHTSDWHKNMIPCSNCGAPYADVSEPMDKREEAIRMVTEMSGNGIRYIEMQIGISGHFVTLETTAVSMAERALKAEAANRELEDSLSQLNTQLTSTEAEIERLKGEIEDRHQAYQYAKDCDEQLWAKLGVPLCENHAKYCASRVACWLIENKAKIEAELASLRASVGEKWIDVKQELPPANKNHCWLAWITSQNKNGGYIDLVSYGEYICFNEECHEGDANYVEHDDGNMKRAGWYREEETHGGEFDYIFVDLNDKVTHWRPLPAPPTLPGEEK